MGVEFEVRVFAPVAGFAERVAVVAPQHDDGVVLQPQPLKRPQQLADLCVGVADAGIVAMTQLARLLGRDAFVFGNIGVAAHLEVIRIGEVGRPVRSFV